MPDQLPPDSPLWLIALYVIGDKIVLLVRWAMQQRGKSTAPPGHEEILHGAKHNAEIFAEFASLSDQLRRILMTLERSDDSGRPLVYSPRPEIALILQELQVVKVQLAEINRLANRLGREWEDK